MKRFAMAALCGAYLLMSFSAFGGSDSTVTVENYSDWVIMEFFMSSSDDYDWGPDQLEEEVLATGDSLTLYGVSCDYWDIMIVDEDNDECVLEEVDLCGDSAVWQITNNELLDCIEDTE